MGFAITVVYVVLTIFGPEQFGAEWASYHIFVYLAAIAFVASLPRIIGCIRARQSIQTWLLLGFIIAIGLSRAVHGWFGGALDSWRLFLPSAAVFFFIVANVYTRRRLKILTIAAVATCLVVVVEGLCGYYGGFRGDTFVLKDGQIVGDFFRLRGVGFLNDPNDFAQMLLVALPLLFVNWRRGRVMANAAIVLVPATLLLWAMYLTHSRGALVALALVALVATQKKLGRPLSVGLATALVLGMLALNFTGGRGISVADGTQRLDAWYVGLELFKSSPLFGTGFGSFTDFSNITAHNSFVLCLAELGLLGSTLWLALLVTTMTSLNRIIKRGEATPITARSAVREEQVFLPEGESSFLETLATTITTSTVTTNEVERDREIRPTQHDKVPTQWIVAMRLALVGFIGTSWFLSRSYSTTMYLILGLAAAAIALQRPSTKPDVRGRFVFYTLAVEAVSVVCIYGLVRLSH